MSAGLRLRNPGADLFFQRQPQAVRHHAWSERKASVLALPATPNTFLGQVTESLLLPVCEAVEGFLPRTITGMDESGWVRACVWQARRMPVFAHARVAVGMCTCVVACHLLHGVQRVSQGADTWVSFWQWWLSWEGTPLLVASRSPRATDGRGVDTAEV